MCSNSLKSDRLQNAAGLLKEEMRRLNSLIIRAVDATRVPAGGALAVDREAFSALLRAISASTCTDLSGARGDRHPRRPVHHRHLYSDQSQPCGKISALSDRAMLSFYDAAAPIVTAESIDMSRVFRASRWARDDYLNCPLDEETYLRFRESWQQPRRRPCMALRSRMRLKPACQVEVLAKRGEWRWPVHCAR